MTVVVVVAVVVFSVVVVFAAAVIFLVVPFLLLAVAFPCSLPPWPLVVVLAMHDVLPWLILAFWVESLNLLVDLSFLSFVLSFYASDKLLLRVLLVLKALLL